MPRATPSCPAPQAISLAEFDLDKLTKAMEEARTQAGSADEMTRVQGEIALEFFEPLEASLKASN